MALTDRQKQTIQTSLQSKLKGGCPMCNTSNWSLENQIVSTPATSLGGGIAIGGPIVPMVQLICTNCGFVSHHAIGALGIQLNEE